jgi:hypothetical protein
VLQVLLEHLAHLDHPGLLVLQDLSEQLAQQVAQDLQVSQEYQDHQGLKEL